MDKTRFNKEVKKNANVSFPNIAIFYDANIKGDFCYARLQYIKGPTLKTFLKQPQEFVLRYNIIKTVLESMVLVYNAGSYHGDLHTKNIIVNEYKPYIIDFGTSIFSGTIASHELDCRMLIDLCYEVIPELHKCEFFIRDEIVEQGSTIAANALLHVLSIVWDLEDDISKTMYRTSHQEWKFKLEIMMNDFPFFNPQIVKHFFTKYITW